MSAHDDAQRTVRLVNRRVADLYHNDQEFHQRVDMAVNLTMIAHTNDLADTTALRRAMTYAASWTLAMTRPEISSVIEQATQEAARERMATIDMLLPVAPVPFCDVIVNGRRCTRLDPHGVNDWHTSPAFPFAGGS